MHETARNNAIKFVEKYVTMNNPYILDVGSYNVNGTLKDVCPADSKYVGIDTELGNGVDCIMGDDYKFPFENNSFNIIMSSSCFEHCDFFWLVILEMIRCLKPQGYIYINVPSSGSYHPYPLDIYRFYPDSGKALVKWINHNNYQCILTDTYMDKESFFWQDNVIIIQKQ